MTLGDNRRTHFSVEMKTDIRVGEMLQSLLPYSFHWHLGYYALCGLQESWLVRSAGARLFARFYFRYRAFQAEDWHLNVTVPLENKPVMEAHSSLGTLVARASPLEWPNKLSMEIRWPLRFANFSVPAEASTS